MEKNYDFRKKLMQIHAKDIRNKQLRPRENEVALEDGIVLMVGQDAGDVILTAAKDFVDYLLVSMDISAMICKNGSVEAKQEIRIRVSEDKEELGEADAYMGYKLGISDSIEIIAHDERGVAQALYYMEDVMNLRKAPYLPIGDTFRKPMFSPRMIHSGYGIDQFPDFYLASVAHAGMDAILVFTISANMTTCGYLDFNELIERAERYGIDVYAYSYMISEKHPDDPDAESYYENTYGKLFETCPKLKGVVLVGESVEFPSKDPHTTGKIGPVVNSKVADGRKRPGWWPCEDYPQWLELIQKVVYRHNEKADIVFWTYNWGSAPLEYREKLIRSLPKGISLQATFEMCEIYEQDGVKERTADYTLCKEGPGKYFLSEAQIAKECGIRLYAMTNTGGLTWDFGTIPYEPFPQQWQRRYDNIVECHEKYGLCGLMESHHYGFYPSFISELSKWNFTESNRKEKDILQDILSARFGFECVHQVREALIDWSEAIRYYNAVEADQYGPFRIGPSYPLCFIKTSVPPQVDYAHFGSLIVDAKYTGMEKTDAFITAPQVRIHHEIRSLKQMEELLIKGVEILKGIQEKNAELEELLGLGQYILCCVRTGIHTKLFCVARNRMDASEECKEIGYWLDEMERIAREEIENAKAAIPLVRANSRLGWEPSMEYLGDEEHINWKINQVEAMIQTEIQRYRSGL